MHRINNKGKLPGDSANFIINATKVQVSISQKRLAQIKDTSTGGLDTGAQKTQTFLFDIFNKSLLNNICRALKCKTFLF